MSQTVRLQSADGIIARTNRGQLIACGTSVPTDGTAGYSPGALFFDQDAAAGSQVFINEGSYASSDFNAVVPVGGTLSSMTITTLTNTTLNGSAGRFSASLAVGGALPTNPQAQLALQPAANASGVTADQSYFHMQILPGGAVTIPTGTAPVVASLNIHEPNITATGTVTAAATVRIVDAPTEGSSNYALWVDSGVTRLDGNLQFSAALDIVAPANTAAALEVTDGTTSLAAFDSRNTVKNASTLTLTASAPTIASETAAHINATLKTADKTITYTGGTGTTSSLGTQAYFGVTTITDSSAMTLDVASAIHINALAAAGGMLTITASRMISTSVSDCYLTNAGVWTDTMCWSYTKNAIAAALPGQVLALLEKLTPRTWKYNNFHGDDRGRQRVGIVYDELPEELRAPGEERGVSGAFLASFALAALRTLLEENRALAARVAQLEAHA